MWESQGECIPTDGYWLAQLMPQPDPPRDPMDALIREPYGPAGQLARESILDRGVRCGHVPRLLVCWLELITAGECEVTGGSRDDRILGEQAMHADWVYIEGGA